VITECYNIYINIGIEFASPLNRRSNDLKLALTIWGNRISPVFDSARKLLIVEVKNTKVVKRQYKTINFEMASDLAQILPDLKINILICGAISKGFSDVIETSAIKLIPFITGHVDAVLESYIENNRVIAEFFMPGCRNKHYRQINGSNNYLNQKIKGANMPRTDGTGPQGQGAGTGRSQGPCRGQGQGKNRGTGQGNGQGRGMGSGQGRSGRK